MAKRRSPRRTVYVYEAPVRIWHWVNALCMVMLFVTGYLIASPPASVTGEASAHFQMGYIRFAHFAAGQILAVFFLLRIYWAFVGNAHARQIFYVPFWRAITGTACCTKCAGTPSSRKSRRNMSGTIRWRI